jgi:hypothetical protein
MPGTWAPDVKGKKKERASGPYPVTVESCDEGSVSQTSTSTPASASQARTSMSSMSPEFMRELVERIKTEVVQGLQQQGAASDTSQSRHNSYTSTAAVTSPLASQPSSTILEPDTSRPTTMKSESPLVSSMPGVAAPGFPNILGVHNGPVPMPPPASAQTYPSAFERRKSSARWYEHKPLPSMGRSASTPEVPSMAPPPPGLDRRTGSYRRGLPDIGWGPLFEPDGNSTERLTRFLKGISNYIMTEFSPANGLVILPANMEAFYARFALDFEVLPLQELFKRRSKTGLERIENLYLDLECEHVLVQAEPKYRADIPALTPAGFEKWMRNLIQAYPDHEAQRLSKVIAELPINPDGSRLGEMDEKLYTALPRRLLPSGGNDDQRRTIWAATSYWRKLADSSKPSPTAEAPTRRQTYDDGPRQEPRSSRNSSRANSRGPSRTNSTATMHPPSAYNKPIIRQAPHSSSSTPTPTSNKRFSMSDMPAGSGSPAGEQGQYVLSSENHRGVETRYAGRDVEVGGGGRSSRRVYVASTPRRRQGSSSLTGLEEERERRRKAYLAGSRVGDRDRDRDWERDREYRQRDRDRDRGRDDIDRDRGKTYDDVFKEQERTGRKKSYDVDA